MGARPCSARAGHLSHKCFLPPHMREVVWGDVAEILCLCFLFLFLLTTPQPGICATLFWSISGHLYFIKVERAGIILIVGGFCLGSAQALVWLNPAEDGGCQPGRFVFTDTKMVLALQKCPSLSGDGCAGWVWVQAGGLTSDFYTAKWLYSHK